MRIRLLSGGAAQGLVTCLQPELAKSGLAVEGTFGAVGAMKDKLLAGDPCDLVILTRALVDELTAAGHVVAGSAKALGVVRTGVAVKAGATRPDVGTAASLKAALASADAIYFPDPQKATAGIHFMKVLKALGLDSELASRMHVFANGQAAMREMAESGPPGAIGCTQVTEILNTDGVTLVDVLPKEFELATVYAAATCTRTPALDAAASFIALLAAPQHRALREALGFETG